jgi:hypothetical protein
VCAADTAPILVPQAKKWVEAQKELIQDWETRKRETEAMQVEANKVIGRATHIKFICTTPRCRENTSVLLADHLDSRQPMVQGGRILYRAIHARRFFPSTFSLSLPHHHDAI